MKIYILPIDKKTQPEDQPWRYPKHSENFGVEQDFLKYLHNNPFLLTDNPNDADWHYLGAYWTRWHVGHDFAKTGLEELQEAVNKAIVDDKKTFTICQYDDGPVVNVGKTIQFLASRKTEAGIDIPLLCSDHELPFFKQKKKYLASFLGIVSTHKIRSEMIDELKGRKDVYIYDGHKPVDEFVKTTLQSYVALTPRGYGGSSFRFFEAMQMGVVPFLIGEPDTRPFQEDIPYDKISLYADSAEKINGMLAFKNTEELLEMGRMCKEIYKEKLAYQKWCPFVIKELMTIL